MASGKDETTTSLGTFRGVYRPTVLTILGLMMYVREGWVVGEAGLLGAVVIILLTFLITGTTALSLSSITTNLHVGRGGVFSIISKSLGLETGGSIGVPLYLGQALSGALYIYGFTEGWLYLFPGHSQWLVAYGILLVAMGAVLVSSKFAFRLQGLVMFVILLSLGSIVLGLTELGGHPTRAPQLWGTFGDASFWTLFAIFFPGGTGIMVGASMSGGLDEPRRSIPRGTLWAVGTALVVYLGMAVWYSVMASPEELRANRLIVIERAAVSELVIAGLLASTFTATISTIVAAPQVLHALAEQNIVPRSEWLSQRTEDGDPRNATFVSALLVALTMLLGSLDAVAVLITMFFLLIYLTINAAITIEQGLGLISFRPVFRIPRWIPVLGAVGCTFALFVINAVFALIALAISFGIYMYLVGRSLETPWQTVRSSIFVSLADWAFKRVARSLDEPNERSWKPDLLVPVTSREQLDGVFRFLRLLAEPKGSIKIVGVLLDSPSEADERAITARGFDRLDRVTKVFHAEELLATSTVVEASSLLHGVRMSASVLRGSAFRPNILFGMAHRYDLETLQGYVEAAEEQEMGVALLYEHPEASLGQERRVNIWITDQSPEWKLGLRLPNLDLSILLGLQVHRKWRGAMRLVTVCREADEVPEAEAYHHRLIEDARLPIDTESLVVQGSFREKLSEAPTTDLNILGLAREVDKELLEEVVLKTRSTCLFVRDSGRESALA